MVFSVLVAARNPQVLTATLLLRSWAVWWCAVTLCCCRSSTAACACVRMHRGADHGIVSCCHPPPAARTYSLTELDCEGQDGIRSQCKTPPDEHALLCPRVPAAYGGTHLAGRTRPSRRSCAQRLQTHFQTMHTGELDLLWLQQVAAQTTELVSSSLSVKTCCCCGSCAKEECTGRLWKDNSPADQSTARNGEARLSVFSRYWGWWRPPRKHTEKKTRSPRKRSVPGAHQGLLTPLDKPMVDCLTHPKTSIKTDDEGGILRVVDGHLVRNITSRRKSQQVIPADNGSQLVRCPAGEHYSNTQPKVCVPCAAGRAETWVVSPTQLGQVCNECPGLSGALYCPGATTCPKNTSDTIYYDTIYYDDAALYQDKSASRVQEVSCMTWCPKGTAARNGQISCRTCPFESRCLGGWGTNCSSGSTGKMCSSCEQGYYSFASLCAKCSGTLRWQTVTAALVGMVVLPRVLWWFSNTPVSILADTLDVIEHGDTIFQSTRMLVISIVWPHFTFSLLPLTLPHITWPTVITSVVNSIRTVAFLDIGSYFGMECFFDADATSAMLGHFVTLHAAFWLILFLFAIGRCCGKCVENRKLYSQRAVNASVFTFMMMHPMLLLSSLKLWHCAPNRDLLEKQTRFSNIETDGSVLPSHAGHLYAYPDVACDTRTAWMVQWMVVSVIALACVYFFQEDYESQGREAEVKLNVRCCKCMILTPGPVILLIILVFNHHVGEIVDYSVTIIGVMFTFLYGVVLPLALLLKIKANIRNIDGDFRARYGYLVNRFDDDSVYWEFWVLARKSSLLLLSTMLTEHPYLLGSTQIILLMVALFYHERKAPFITNVGNSLEALSLFCLLGQSAATMFNVQHEYPVSSTWTQLNHTRCPTKFASSSNEMGKREYGGLIWASTFTLYEERTACDNLDYAMEICWDTAGCWGVEQDGEIFNYNVQNFCSVGFGEPDTYHTDDGLLVKRDTTLYVAPNPWNGPQPPPPDATKSIVMVLLAFTFTTAPVLYGLHISGLPDCKSKRPIRVGSESLDRSLNPINFDDE
eukprot:COSAG01_NODE_308_length_19148_cov_13.076697_6_plen_1036_part_00